jgi:hypothetical protein
VKETTVAEEEPGTVHKNFTNAMQGAGGVAQVVEHLPRKCKALSSNVNISKNSSNTVRGLR